MKPSKYNYTVPYNNGIIFMNGITEASFWVNGKFAHSINSIINAPTSYPSNLNEIISKLKRNGFIVEKNTNEDLLINTKYKQLRNEQEYHIMILPTYQCNLRCWYCIQEHNDDWLTENHINAIKNLIRSNASSPTINTLNISWFGGEPLMAYDKIINVTKFAKNFTKLNNKEFNCNITTNGVLLNKKRIDELHEAGVTHYQITIDGPRDIHNEVKKSGNISTFDKTLLNISYLAQHSSCIIRFNYTKSNLKPDLIVNQLKNILPDEIRHNLSFNLQPVWQTASETVDFSLVLRMMDLLHKAGIRPYLKPCGLCYVDHANYDCIYPSGVVGKCENGIKGMKHGTLLSNGTIDRTNADTEYYVPAFETENSECKSCKYLPFCWGPCAPKRFVSLKNENKINCIWKNGNREESIGELIINKHLNDIYISKRH